MDEEEDIIVEEIPIYLSKALKDSLYVLQYPNKLNHTNFDKSKVVNCCIKPINQEVKIDFALETACEYYDQFKGEQFALAADGKGPNKTDRPTFRRGIMDKQSFTSSKSLEDVDKYVVGILHDGEIHLSTIASVLQMRPSLSYFDKQDKRAKAEQKSESDYDNEEEKLQQVTVKFSRADADRLQKAREKTYEYHVKKIAEEPWCETFWHPRTSTTSELERQKLFASRMESIGHSLSLNPSQYIQKLVLSENSDQNIESILPSKVVCKAKLKTMGLTEQIRIILKDCKMLSFNGLMSVLEEVDKQITADKVLRALPLTAVLIRGNWVPQSEVLYPPESVSNINGVPAELMIRGRDYILYQFSKQNFLHRRKVIIATQLPHEEVHEILQSVARINSEKKWELLLPPDHNFEAKYSELVQRQEMVWRARESSFNEMDYEKSPKRVRKRSIRDVKTEKST